MKYLSSVFPVAVLFVLLSGSVQTGNQSSYNPEVQWAIHLFERVEIEHVRYAPYEISDLPRQLDNMGLDGERVVFGRRFTSFTGFRDAFEEAMADNPVSSEALTDWQESIHQGISVQTRIYRIGDMGIGVTFFRPNVIFADLGPYDESLANKNRLVELNR